MPPELPRDIARCTGYSCPMTARCRRFKDPQHQDGPYGYQWADYRWEGSCEGLWPLGHDEDPWSAYSKDPR